MSEILVEVGHMHYAQAVLEKLNEKMKGRKPLFPVTMLVGAEYNDFIATVIVE